MRDLTDLATERELGRGGQPAVAARELHARRQDLLRAGQHPLLAVAVAVEQGLRGRRRAGARPTGTSSSPPRPRCARPARSRSAVGGQAWQTAGAFNVLMVALGGKDLYIKVYGDKDAEVAAGPGGGEGLRRRPTTPARWRKGTNVQDWNQATNLVITGQAGGQIMGDWAQGEFQVAGQVAGKDYTCLPGLGVNEIISTGGDAFYFPLLDDEEKSRGAGGARLGDDLAGDPGRLQPQEGLAAGARRRRPRRRQRLHEEGPRDPARRATSVPAPTS